MALKTQCNTTINKDLLNKAKALNIKLSPIFESALALAVREEKKGNIIVRPWALLLVFMTMKIMSLSLPEWMS